MALQTDITIKGKRHEGAYLRVRRIRALEKDRPIVAEICVYANASDRLQNREPVETFTVEVPYSPQPYQAIFAALAKAYPGSTNV